MHGNKNATSELISTHCVFESSVASRLNCNIRVDNLQKKQTFEFSIDNQRIIHMHRIFLALFFFLTFTRASNYKIKVQLVLNSWQLQLQSKFSFSKKRVCCWNFQNYFCRLWRLFLELESFLEHSCKKLCLIFKFKLDI